MSSGDDAVHIHKLEQLRVRLQRGDTLYSDDAIRTLFKEIELLSEQLQARGGLLGVSHSRGGIDNLHPELRKVPLPPRSGTCEAYARKGTGFGTCEAPTSNGFCPRWRDHVEED